MAQPGLKMNILKTMNRIYNVVLRTKSDERGVFVAKEKTKWKWNEYSQWKEKQQQPTEPEEKPVPAGRCECGSGRFSLRINKGKMDRICRGCGEILENV